MKEVVKVIKTKAGRWEVFISDDNYCTRLISRNGKVICFNHGFNTLKGALKNIKAVQNTCK